MKKKWLDVRTARHVSDLKASSILIYGMQKSRLMSSLIQGTVVRSHCLVHRSILFRLKVLEDYIPEDLKKPLIALGSAMVHLHYRQFPKSYQKVYG